MIKIVHIGSKVVWNLIISEVSKRCSNDIQSEPEITRKLCTTYICPGLWYYTIRSYIIKCLSGLPIWFFIKFQINFYCLFELQFYQKHYWVLNQLIHSYRNFATQIIISMLITSNLVISVIKIVEITWSLSGTCINSECSNKLHSHC